MGLTIKVKNPKATIQVHRQTKENKATKDPLRNSTKETRSPKDTKEIYLTEPTRVTRVMHVA